MTIALTIVAILVWYIVVSVFFAVARNMMVFQFFESENFPRSYALITEHQKQRGAAYLDYVTFFLKRIKLIVLLVSYSIPLLVYTFINL